MLSTIFYKMITCGRVHTSIQIKEVNENTDSIGKALYKL